MKKLLLSVIVLIAAVAAFVVFQKSNQTASDGMTPTPTVSQTPVMTSTATPVPSITSSATPKASATPGVSAIKTFTVIGTDYAFSLKQIKVKKGDTVKIIFTNTDGQHNWVIDEFNARTPIIQTGKSATVQFIADKTGTFEYYCSVGVHRQMGMKGSLIVE